MIEQGEPALDFPPKKLARQLDFAAISRAPENVILPSHSPQSRPALVPSHSPQSRTELVPSHSPQLRTELVPSHSPQSRPELEPQPQSPYAPVPPQKQMPQSPYAPVPPQKQMSHSPLPRSAFSPSKSESPGRWQGSSIDINGGTPKRQKQCNCKNSKCLKLYCECFASGNYCDGCNCTCCHNNLGYEAARQEAIGAILERNAYAFRAKISNSPHGLKDGKQESYEAQMLMKYNKGCNCKRSGCRKKYCECFQANIMCTRSCGCVDCRNSGNPPVVKKRKVGEILIRPKVAANQLSGYRVFQIQQENHARATPVSSISVPASHMDGGALVRSMKLAYRSPLADIIQPQDIYGLCSRLIVCSKEAANALEGQRDEISGISKRDNGSASISLIQLSKVVQKDINVDEAELHGAQSGLQAEYCRSTEGDIQDDKPMSPATLALICDEKDRSFMGTASPNGVVSTSQFATMKVSSNEGLTDVYGEQERHVLTMFRDVLTRIITCAGIKEASYSPWSKN